MSKSTEKGQALIFVALAAIGLFAFAALAIDGSRAFSDKRNAQNAADTAALAAALAKIRGQDYAAAAIARAASNGYTNGGNRTVEVHLCNEAGVTCQGIPTGANASEYILVKIVSTIPSTFARVIGRQTLTSAVDAVAHAGGSSSTSSQGGDALVGLRQTGCDICANGNVFLDINGGGAFSNSTSSSGDCSMDYSGNGTYSSDGGYTVAGTGALCKSGNVTVNGAVQSGAQIPYPPDISIPAPTFACSGNGSVDVIAKTVSPGNFNSHLDLNGIGNYTFQPGNYCFNNGVTINGAIHATATNVNFRINASSFQINGNSTLICNNVLVYGAGGTGMEFNGNGSNTCTNVSFYMQSGKVVWNGNVTQTFKAPTSGTYKGLLIYLPYGNNSELTINGNSGNQLTGSIIAPSSPITINGNSGTAGLRTQIIGYYITLNGNSNTTINYDPNEQYNPPHSPTIQLTK